MVTQALLHSMFSYDTNSGELVRKTAPNYRTRVGDVAGCVSGDGYRKIKINGTAWPAHRLVWLYVFGKWPDHEIDHINGAKSDNRIENLRDVPHQVNVQNLRAHTSSSSTGILGVGPKYGRWRARITVNGKPKTIGTFATKAEAEAAYIAAKRVEHKGCTI